MSSATQLFLNDQLVTITAEPSVIKRLNEDDQFLADYINKAAKMGQFSFLFKDHSLRRIIVRRASVSPPTPAPYKPVWLKKNSSSEYDTAATALLLKLRGSDKYLLRFKDSFVLRAKLWEELANDMRMEGYDVDGAKCSQKFMNLAQAYYKYKNFIKSCSCSEQKMYPPEFYNELDRILGGESEGSGDEGDEEWLPRTRNKRKRIEEEADSDDLLKNLLKRNCALKEERYKEVCDLLKKRNNLIKERIKQNAKIISLLEKFVTSF